MCLLNFKKVALNKLRAMMFKILQRGKIMGTRYEVDQSLWKKERPKAELQAIPIRKKVWAEKAAGW